MNKNHHNAKSHLYKDFPEKYVWDKNNKFWYLRKQRNVIGRIVAAYPTEGERYYLRLLLHHIKGATSYTYLKTINGIETSSFREAALLHGLLYSDDYLEQSLKEASCYQMPYTLRRLFATILVYCLPNNPKSIWEKFKQAMSEDYTKLSNLTKEDTRKKVLLSIISIMESMRKDINNYTLIDEKISLTEDDKSSKEMEEELTFIVSDKDLHSINKLNTELKLAYDKIIGKIFSNDHGAFFLLMVQGVQEKPTYIALCLL